MIEMSSPATVSRPPPPHKPLDLDLTIISAKHIKNVNWRNGDLKPYVVFWVDPDRRLATKSDDSGSTCPVWNERFTISIPFSLHDAVLTLEIFHSKPSETPKPLVGTLRVPLMDIGSDPDDFIRIRTYELIRPSGRPQGKIRVKIAIRENYHFAPPPPPGYYYSSAPPPPLPRDYYRPRPPPMSPPLPPPQPTAYGAYSDPFYYSSASYYSSAPPPPLPSRPMFDNGTSRAVGGSGYGGGPSAPVDYSPYDNQKQPPQQKVGKMGPGGLGLGLGAGLAVGGVAGALGGLALDEGLKYDEEKIEHTVETDLNAKDNYSNYRADY